MSVRGFVVLGALLLIVGLGLAIAGGGASVLFVVGVGCIGLGTVILTAAVFYVIGRSEDEDRKRHPSG
jgi:hypothetical protein